MTTLHIEHPITDFATWQAAFDQFAGFRAQAGVRSQRVQQPVDDNHYIVIDLDFDTVEQAHSFLTFLQTKVWSSSTTSPGLGPRVRKGSAGRERQMAALMTWPRTEVHLVPGGHCLVGRFGRVRTGPARAALRACALS